MNLYLLSQKINKGYDTYDSCVVVAEDRDLAKMIVPFDIDEDDEDINPWSNSEESYNNSYNRGWCNTPEEVTVEYLGVAKEGSKENTVICSSFNAG